MEMIEMYSGMKLSSVCSSWILLVSLDVISLSDSSAVQKCGPHEYNLDGQRCCTKCSPGSGVQTACTVHNDTMCAPCTFGESYSNRHSRNEPCNPCSICQEYSHTVRSCNQTHDTACRCDQNYFREPVSGRCRPCQFCPMEFGVSRPCNRTHDRICSRCSEGYYSDRLGTEPCKRCGVCAMHQVMLQHCSPGQNTICIAIPTIRNTPPMESFTGSVEPTGDHRHQVNPIPIYCAILGALVFALIVYVIIKQSQRRQLLKNKAQNLSTSASAECPPLLSGVSSSAGVNSKHGSDSGVFVEQDRSVAHATRVRDLPPAKRKALENSMHGYREDQGGWKNLARELGFSNPMVSSIETRAHQDGFSPLRILLNEWGKRDNAIVGTLVQALRCIHREDCIRILCGDNREYMPPPKYIDLGSLHSQVI